MPAVVDAQYEYVTMTVWLNAVLKETDNWLGKYRQYLFVEIYIDIDW